MDGFQPVGTVTAVEHVLGLGGVRSVLHPGGKDWRYYGGSSTTMVDPAVPPFAEECLPIIEVQDIVRVRVRARELAKLLGFGLVDQTRIATAVSELARNVVRYATEGRGDVYIRALCDQVGRAGLEIVVADHGPGIADLDQALRAGFTSGPGLGMGLPGTRRLMDEMAITSELGRGTVVTIRKWRR
jgi:serine/threonine-protein kinase RsbT